MKNLLKFAVLGGTLAMSSACASYSAKTVHMLTPADYAINMNHDGINVGVEAYDTDAKTKEAFDQNLVRKGVFPVQIVFDNVTEETMLIARDRIELASEQSDTIRPMNAAEVADKVEANALAHAVFGFGIFSYAAAQNANEERAADYANKQLGEEVLLRPGRGDGGFVFFDLGDERNLSGRKLLIPVESTVNGEEKIIEIEL